MPGIVRRDHLLFRGSYNLCSNMPWVFLRYARTFKKLIDNPLQLN